MDDSKTPEQKAEETEEAVQRWESSSPVESPPSYADFDEVHESMHILKLFYIGGHVSVREFKKSGKLQSLYHWHFEVYFVISL